MKKISSLGKVLSREESKKVVGGDYNNPGCCAHNSDWSWSYCEPDLSRHDAIEWATEMAESTGQHHYWCCDSC